MNSGSSICGRSRKESGGLPHRRVASKVASGVIMAASALMLRDADGGPCAPPIVKPDGPRYLTVTPSPANPGPVAIVMTIETPGPPCSRFVDLATAAALREAGVGRVVDSPVFRTADEWGDVHVRGQEVIPSTTYRIQVDCGTPSTPDRSPVVTATTPIWGDVVGPFSDKMWTLPDGRVEIVTDAIAVIEAFRNTPSAPPREQVDVFPDVPDYVITILDLASVLDAFRGFPYPGDCNQNGVPDTCDVQSGPTADCNLNGVPDECDPDCDNDGIPDDCEAFEDCDDDGVQDCLDQCPCTNPTDRPCLCPDVGLCCFDTLCQKDVPREACLVSGGTPDCLEAVCREGCLVGDFDFDGDVDAADLESFDACFAGPDVLVDAPCQPGDFDDDGDVDCGDWEQFVSAWTEVAPPPVNDACACLRVNAPQPLPDGMVNSRYLSFVGDNPGEETAIRVTFKDLPPPYDAWNGVQMWLLAPEEFCEQAATRSPSAEEGCPEPDTIFMGATLGCAAQAHRMDWSSVGVLHVYHEGIIPQGVYDIQALDAPCGPDDESLYSDPLEVANSRWTDCCGPFTGTEFPPPDGIIDLVTDCRAYRDKVADNPVAPITARIDVEPKVPDQRVTITDVLDALDAFRGLPYPPLRFGPPGPRPCEP